MNGVIMVANLNRVRDPGLPLMEAVVTGASERLRPVLMTATVATVGIRGIPPLPALDPGYSAGSGAASGASIHNDIRRFECARIGAGWRADFRQGLAYPTVTRSAVGSQIMSRFWSPVVHSLSPYVPGEQPKLDDIVKLNTNENPYGPSSRVLAAIASATDRLRLYPDPCASSLCETIAARYDVATEEVFVGNGSDEVLAHIFQALLKHDAPLLFPDITYSFYPVYCGLYGIRYEEVPLDAAMRVQIAGFRRPCSAILLPNPNAPTGIGLPREAIEALVAEHPDQLMVIDEAYVDFGAESAVSLVARHDNLLIVQTLSKSRALAGLRVGFAIGQRPLIEALERVKGSFNSYPLDCLAIAGAVAAMKDDAWFQETRERIIANRESLVHALSELGFEVLPSVANFVFARHGSCSGAHLAAQLRELGVLVRHFQKPRIEDFLRITVGTEDQCRRLIALARRLI
jgi:histidinol-phosphate aminotransferase